MNEAKNSRPSRKKPPFYHLLMTSAILFQPTQLYGCTASAPAVRRPPRLVRPPIPSPTPKKCVGVCHAREGKPHGDNRELRKKNPTGRAGLAWVPPRRATGSKIFTSERAGNFRRSRLLFFSGIVPQASAPELAACGSPSLPLPHTHTHTQIPPSPQSSHVLKLEDQTEHRTRSFGRGRTTIGLRRRNP